MDKKQKRINDGIDELYAIYGITSDENMTSDLAIDDYYHELKSNIEELCIERGVEYSIQEEDKGKTTIITYKMNGFNLGILNIKMEIDQTGKLLHFLIRGFNKEINELANLAELTEEVFNVPIFKFMLFDENREPASMFVMVKNW